MHEWKELLDTEEEWDKIHRFPGDLGPKRTPAYHAARRRRVDYLRRQIERGLYEVPALLVAEAILYGRPVWGESFIDEHGRRADEKWWEELLCST